MKIILFNTFVSIIITLLCFVTNTLGSGTYIEFILPVEFVKYYFLGIIPTGLIIHMILGEKHQNFSILMLINKVFLGYQIKEYELIKMSKIKIILYVGINLCFYLFIFYFMYNLTHDDLNILKILD